MDIRILKLANLKSSVWLNMQRLLEADDKAPNASNDNGTRKNIEELDKLRQIPEERMVILWKLVTNETFLWKNLRHWNRF